MNDKPITLLVDVDSVLRNFTSAVVDFVESNFDAKLKFSDWVLWDMEKNFTGDVPKNLSELIFNSSYTYDILASAPAIYDNCHLMLELYNKYNISIVTYQKSDMARMATLKWLETHGIQFDSLYFTKYKYNVPGDVLIDDKISNLTEFEFLAKKKSIAVTQHWNVEWKGARVHNFSTLDEVIGSFDLLKNS